MKRKRLISMLLVLVLVLSILPAGVSTLASTVPTAWAIPEMNDANTSGLLTPNAAKDFHRALTRDEFCELVVDMVEQTLGKDLPIPAYNPFTDCDSVYVQKANLYGVINGVGDNKFDPRSSVERQQLCTMMIRAIRSLERDTGRVFLKPAASSLPFKDNSKIADYAVESIKLAYSNDIMRGDDTNNFNPKSNITSQECVAVIIRSFNSMQDTLASGKTDAQLVDMAYDRLHIGFAYGDTENGVTRGVVLPSTGTGSSAITWRSNNESVISSSGAVVPGTSPVTVTLTATIKLGSVSRDKAFTLKTSPYTNERLLVENAYNELDIVYLGSGDGPNSVTSRICLPSSVLSLPVTWSTSDSSVITRTGQVYVPSGSDVKSVTLTATITSGPNTRTKYFDLKVNNPLYSKRSVSLFGVELGMSQTQVSQVLGSAKRTLQVSSTESWCVYHDSYKNFVAVSFIGNKSVAVYSSATDVSSQLKDASQTVLTVAQANGLNSIRAVSFTDPGNSNREYAIMLSEPSSVIGTSRSLYSEGQEQLLLELINAFRYRNSRTVLTWNTKLGTSARSHSTDMGNYNYLSVTSRNSNNTFQDRASAQGYESKLVSNGNVLGGATDVVEYFNTMLGTSATRNDILGSNNTVFGAGFAGGYNGQYKTYLTFVFGTLKPVTGITSNQTTVSVDIGKTANATLTLTPTGYNETFTVTSSNTNIMTVTNSGATVTAKGVAAGNANIIVTCATSGYSTSIPVRVGAAYATNGLSLSYPGGTLIGSTTASTSYTSSQLWLGMADTLQLTAATNPVGASVEWSSSNTNIATVNSSGVITPKAQGQVTITAKAYQSANKEIKHTVVVNVVSAISITPTSVSINLDSPTTPSLTASMPSGAGISAAWISNNEAIAKISAPANTATASTVTVTGQSSGTTTITITLTKAGCLNSFTRTISVNVTGASEYPTNLTLSETRLTLKVGDPTVTVTPIITPSNAKNKTVIWESDKPSVASVDQNGAITAVANGRAVISAIIRRPTSNGGDLVAYLIVDVIKAPTDISINEDTGLNTAAVGATLQLTLTLTDTDADGAVTWTSLTPSIATVDASGMVTFIAAGTATIIVRSAHNATISDTIDIVVT